MKTTNAKKTTKKMFKSRTKLARKKYVKKCCVKKGGGIIDKIIDKLPIELHLPRYQYCGPGTKLEKRLARGDPGINRLDVACKDHDIAYSKHSDSGERSLADKSLQEAAMKRVFSKDASLGERATALGVAAAMKAKRSLTKVGKGMTQANKRCVNKKKKEIAVAKLIKNARAAIKKSKPENIDSAIKVAIAAVKKHKKGKLVKNPRIIKLPAYTGGVLPLIPIFAGLSALGTIVGSTAGIVNAINNTKNAQKELEESQRHNKTMEAIAIGTKSGKGFYLHPNKNGAGFYLAPESKNF